LCNYALKYLQKRKSKKSIHHNILRLQARKSLLEELELNMSNAQELVQKLLECIHEDLQLPRFHQVIPQKIPRKKLPPPTTIRLNDDMGQRKRQRWTPQEDRILIENHQQFAEMKLLWGMICGKLSNRTNVDCKDRWRNLMKKYKTTEAIYQLLNPIVSVTISN
jgi:hypothetical protein